MKELCKGWCSLLLLLILCSCGQRDNLAPVFDSKWREVSSHAKQHVVIRGETLYAIAFRYDQDYRQLAMINHLSSPYTLRVRQILRLQGTQPSYSHTSVAPPKPTYTHYVRRPVLPIMKHINIVETKPQYSGWLWPVRGKVVSNYFPEQGKKGIDIAGKKGERIYSAGSGVVAYAGNGLSGYGNLIIIKHDNQYLTAYGNNSRNLVKEGQRIKRGQAIAEIGVMDRRYWGVHFEIRKAGKPVNPMNYLQKG